MMKKLFWVIGLAMAFASCVNQDYDLSEEIDLNISVGGNLGLPSSSTNIYTLDQIFELDTSSCIKPVGKNYGLSEGDYVLVQDGTPVSSSIEIPLQNISVPSSTEATAVIPFEVPSGGGNVLVDIPNMFTKISISDNNINRAIVSLTNVKTNIPLDIKLSASSQEAGGSVSFNSGFSFILPEACTVKMADNVTGSQFRIDGNKVIFNEPVLLNINSFVSIPIIITGIDMTRLPQNQGIYAPGCLFFEQEISYRGPISINASGLSAGDNSSIKLAIKPIASTASITAITGKINPEINISPSSFSIDDIPDFLKEPDNNLDVENPQIYLTVANSSECELNINGCLTAIDENGNITKVWLGNEHNTAPIKVLPHCDTPNGVTRICLSRTGRGDNSADFYVAVPELSSLIATIPNTIKLENIDIKVNQEHDVTFELGRYDFNIDCKVVVPLAFGSSLEFTYTTDDTGWNEDLYKYSFKKVVATVTVSNTVPLNMIPEVKALNNQGLEINDVEASVEGFVAAGTLDAPKESNLVITITSTTNNIGNLDGVRFIFKATSGANAAGVPLNMNQALQFTNISLKLVGGVGIDLE